MSEVEYWYRYHEVRYAGSLTEWGDYTGKGRLEVHLHTYPVLKHTAKGVWLACYISNKRFVRLKARKRYACPTKAEALESFVARKKAQQRILESQLDTVREVLDQARYIHYWNKCHELL